jgi:dTDP-4-amino-4,6-dideoxygalactose transaminase
VRDTYLPYCRPSITDAEIEAVTGTLRNGWLSTGPVVAQFEREWERTTGVRHAIALNSCTAALHVGMLALGVGAGDEVVMPSLTFVAGAQCALELGATPVFADIDPATLSVNLATITRACTPRTKAIVTMPYGGRPLGIAQIVDFAHRRGIAVLEDAAHAAGMLDRGAWSGTHSDIAAYSFYATKNLTSAEGGVLLTNDDGIAERARVLSLHGMDRDAWKRYSSNGSWRYDVCEPGFKYNLADPLAAIGLVQLHRLEEMQRRREELARRYRERMSNLPGIGLPSPVRHPDDRHSYCMFVALVDGALAGIDRDTLIERLRDARIGTSVHYIPTHLLSAYRRFGSQPLAVTESVWETLISLPLYPDMTNRDVDDVVGAIRQNLSPHSVAVS